MTGRHVVALDWKGPFSLDTEDGRNGFNPPNEQGVYLWTIPKDDDFKIAYVGEAGDIAARLYQHFHYHLGGGYELYDTEALRTAVMPTEKIRKYEPGPAQLLHKFLGGFERLSKLALDNLYSYRFFWAAMAKYDDPTRLLTESALIKCARKQEHPIQNYRVSRLPKSDHPIQVVSLIGKSVPSALAAPLDY